MFHLSLSTIILPRIDPVIMQIGPFSIRWYALAYIVGILVGWSYGIKIARDPRFWSGSPIVAKDSPDDLPLENLPVWIVCGIIFGGRLGYVLFYDPVVFLSSPWSIFAIWNGGMSFHGGMIGLSLSFFLFTLKYKKSFYTAMDIAAIVAPIGLALGRVGNFINGELIGRPSDAPWAVIFPNSDGVPRHPSQLYEAMLEGVVLFLFMRFISLRYQTLLRPGLNCGFFLLGYGVFRVFSEFFREPDQHIGYLWTNMTMGMLLSFPLIATGIVLIIIKRHGKTLPHAS